MEKKLSELTDEDWLEYEWVEVTTYSDAEPVFLRGAEIDYESIEQIHAAIERMEDLIKRKTGASLPISIYLLGLE